MAETQRLRGRSRLVRTALAAGLAVVALLSFRKGKRLRGALAGLGAIALGYSTWSKPDEEMVDVVERVAPGSAGEESGLHCANCGDPIVAGQSRVPNEDDETVHEDCLEAST